MAVDFWTSKTVWLTSKWSGVAGMDIAVELWRACLERLGCDVVVRSYSFTEWSEPAQRMLTTMPTEHLFSDIHRHFPPSLIKQLAKKQAEILEDYLSACRAPGLKASDRGRLKREHIRRFQMYVDEVLQVTSTTAPLAAPCSYHGGCCCITPPDTGRDDVLWIDCGSPPCTSFSARGKRLNWLCPTNIPTILWAHFLSSRDPKPHIVFGENVPTFGFDWWKSLSPAYQWHDATVGPWHIGIPVSGDRLWWAGLNLEKLSLSVPQPLAEDRLTELIYRSIDAYPMIFVRASAEQVRAYEEFVNKHGAKLAAHPRGKRLRFEDYMSTAAQLRLCEHRANAVQVRQKHPHLAARDFYYDISQHVSHSRQPDGLLPRPATSSSIWSEAENRLLHPLEVWASQGPHASFS